MDFEFSEEQRMLRDAVRDFMNDNCSSDFVRQMEEDERGYTQELWDGMAQLGWMGLLIPEEYCGIGWGLPELMVMMEEMGRVCLPGPFLSTTLGAQVLMHCADPELCGSLLPQVADGRTVLALALLEDGCPKYDPALVQTSAAQKEAGWLLSGAKMFVSDAEAADYLIVSARSSGEERESQGVSLFLLEKGAPGLKLQPLLTVAGDKQCRVVLEDTPAQLLGQPGEAWPVLERLLQTGALAKCAEMVGGADKVLQMTVQYAKEREQFGVPIGSFQAVQHHCANMLMDLEGSRFITYKASWAMAEGLPCGMLVAAAKAFVNQACRRVASLGHQIGAATAYIVEHDMTLYSRRAKAAELAFGDVVYHREQAARFLGL